MERFRLGAVGVNLGLETGLVNLSQQGRQVPVYSRFPSRYTETVHPVLERTESVKYRLKGDCLQRIGL